MAATALGFDRAGAHLAAGAESGTATVWDVSSRLLISRFNHGTAIRTLAFSVADPPMLFLAGYGGISYVPWRPSDVRQAACGLLGRKQLTGAEWNRFVGDGVPQPACQ